MLADRRDDAYQVMETIAVKQGIDGLRMYNRTGQVTFSTVQADRGRQMDPNSENCRGCHTKGQRLERLVLRDRERFLLPGEGRMREDDLQIGKIGRDIVHVHRVRVFQPHGHSTSGASTGAS